MIDENQMPQKPKSNPGWLWIVLIILLILVIGYCLFQNSTKNNSTDSTKTSEKDNDSSNTTTDKVPDETWLSDDEVIIANVTSSDTHLISENLIRTYYMAQGGFLFAESADGGKTYGKSAATGITEDDNLFMSNPSILKISDNNWIMVYEQQPRRQPGQSNNMTPPGPATQRNLYLATSTDGKTFKKSGLVYDSSKEDNYFASVPDLILLPDGKIRMYFVSGGNAIGSAVSSDQGKNWLRDNGYRLSDSAVDPDVIKVDDKWLMYYSVLDPSKNGLYVSLSDDGITWQTGKIIISKQNNSGSLVDPDVFEFDNERIMLYGSFSSTDSTNSSEQPNLIRATLQE